MATFAGLPDPTQVSSADAAARLAAAQAANLAWRTNTAPVLPRMGAPAPGSPGTEQDLTRIYVGGTADVQGTPMDLTRSQYIAQFGRTPEEAESAKHMEHFHPAEFFGTNMAALQGMTLGQIASRYGTRVADYVQDYSREHPSARFQAITQAYEAQKQRSIDAGGAYYQPTAAGSGKNPYPEDSAAGITWEINRTGGTVGKTLGEKSYAEGYNPLVNFSAIERATVPTRLAGSGMIAGMASTAEMQAGTVPVFMAIGGYQGVEIPSAKLAIDYATGEFGVYAKAPGHSVYNLIGGGGRAAAQSGMFSVGESLWSPERTFQLGDIGRMQPVSREYQATHSKAGAEAYGGYSTVLTGKLLEPTSKVSRFENLGNLANYVQQIPAGKAEEPGAKIPWSLPSGAPVAQYMDETGLLGVPVKIPTGEGRLVGGKTVASVAMVSEAPTSGLPKPFISTSTPAAAAPVAEMSIYDRLKQSVRETLNLPSPEVGERMTSLAEWSNPFLTPYKLEEAATGKSLGRELLGYKGQYTQFYEDPILTGVAFGTGGLLGTAAKGLEIGYMGARAAAAERIISTGGKYRAVEQLGGTVMSRAPQVLTALYGIDIAGRATNGGTEITPEAAGRGRAIVAQEAYPMMLGFEAPGQVIKGVRTGQQTIAAAKQAIAEERTMAQRGLDIVVGTEPAKPSVALERVPAGAEVSYERVPLKSDIVMSEAMLNANYERIFAKGAGGEVVGAVAYKTTPEGVYIKAIGSMEKGTGSILVGEVKEAARAGGLPKITGEATSVSQGFWTKQGAKYTSGETTGLHPFEISVGPKSPVYTTKMVSKAPVKPSDVSLEDALRYMYEPRVRAGTQKALDVLSGDIMGTTISPMRVSAKTPSLAERISAAKKGISTYFDRPYPSEVSRSYYPYAGIETKAYPKTGPSAGDIIRGVKAKGMDVLDIPYQFAATARRTPVTPEITRPIYPEYSTTGVYQKTTLAEKQDAVTGFMYGLKVKSEKILPPSTFGETKPLYGLYTVQGKEPGKATTGGKPSGGTGEGVSKTRPQQFRETTVGGRKRVGLAKEPVLKGAGEKTGLTEVAKQVYGKRLGEPSRRMKPMDTSKTKQAPSAVQIMREPLPKVEGMPEGARATTRPRNIYLAPSVQIPQQQRMKVVSVVEPTLEFRQESRAASVLSGLSGITTIQAEMQVPKQERRTAPMFGIQEAVLQGTVLGTSQKIATEEAQRKDTRLTTLPTLEFRTGLEESTKQEEKQTIGTSFRQDLALKTGQITTQVPVGFEILRKVPPPPIPPEFPKFGLPGLPGGGGAGGGYRKGSRGYVETLGLVSKQFDPFRKSKAKPRKKSKWSF